LDRSEAHAVPNMLKPVIALSAALLAASSPCLGAAPTKHAAPAPDARVTEAQASFDQARALVKQGRVAEACPLFEKSERLDPGLGTEFNLADCHERLGRLASAHRLFTHVADRAHATAQDQRARIARARAAAIVPRLSKLVIRVPGGRVSGLRVERDGAELPSAEWNMPVPVDPGQHRVRAWGPGIGEWATQVAVTTEGVVHEVVIPVSDEPAFFDPLHRKLGLVAAGVGVVGVSLGTFFGVRAITKKNEAERAGCDGPNCDSQSAEIREEARSAGNLATLTMSIGAAGLATGAVLLWVVSDSEPEAAEANRSAAALGVRPEFATHGAGLFLHGEF
jgi:hypothetical protein